MQSWREQQKRGPDLLLGLWEGGRSWGWRQEGVLGRGKGTSGREKSVCVLGASIPSPGKHEQCTAAGGQQCGRGSWREKLELNLVAKQRNLSQIPKALERQRDSVRSAVITSAFSKAPSVAAMLWLEWGLAAEGQADWRPGTSYNFWCHAGGNR